MIALRTKAKQYEMDMCSGPILRKMLMFALPLMLSSILQLLFNAADIVVVGKFAGDNSLAAVGSNTALINLLTNLFIGLSIGANVVAARSYGAKAWDDLRDTVHTSMLLSMISGGLLMVLGVIGARQMLIWMQTPEEVLPLATTYLRIYFLGMASTMVYNFGSALLRAVGDTKRPLYFLLCAGVINVVLNLIFVVGFHLDVMGVAIATVISETVSALLVLRCLMKESGGISGRGIRIVQRGDPVLGQHFRKHRGCRKLCRCQSGGVRVHGNERLLSDHPFLCQPELRGRGTEANPSNRTSGRSLRDRHWYAAGKCGCIFRKRIASHLLQQSGSHCRGNRASALYLYGLRSLRHYGRYGGSTAWYRIFCYADDRFHCGRVCAASGVAGDGVPDSGISPNRNGLSVLSGHVDTDQSCLYRVLYLGTRPNVPKIGCCLIAFEKLLYAPKAYGRFFYFCIKFVLQNA